MKKGVKAHGILVALRLLPYAVFVVVLVTFASLSSRFLQVQNFLNILVQAAPVAIAGIGMTFVLLTGGIDLSVGAVMYLSACILGVFFKSVAWPVGLLLMMACGSVWGALNAVFITRLRVVPFIVTLATLFIARGAALYLSNTKMIFLPKEVTGLNRLYWFGIPFAIWTLAVVLAVAWVILRETPFGRQIYAVGADPVAAEKAGLKVGRILFLVYCISGACAGMGGFVSITQVGAVSPSFALEREFAVIAAAVLGGTSLFGGRGGVGGTIFGAILIQTVNNGLVIINANPYIYPLVTAAIIFLAVLVDSLRERILKRLQARQIRVEEGGDARLASAPARLP
ncbi:MAG TPA: ABC transporter permease [Chthoniobacterales bacterium]